MQHAFALNAGQVPDPQQVGGEPDSIVQVANLVYATTKSSQCFADHFLVKAAEETAISTSRRFHAAKLGSDEIYSFPLLIMTGEGSFTLTDKERDIHDRGLVTLLRQHHDAIDTAVAESYGWPADLSDEDILTLLVALNKARAAEEAKGLIRWLRPEFQAPGAEAPKVNATLDLGDTPVAAPATIIPWPKTLAEQVSTVAAILATSQTPKHPSEIARAIKGTNAKGVMPVLDALAAIGQARKLADGRFAA